MPETVLKMSHIVVPESLDKLSAEISQYDDFHTIDWVRDTARYRKERKDLKKNRKDSCWGTIKDLVFSLSGWIIVLLVGLATGRYSWILCYFLKGS